MWDAEQLKLNSSFPLQLQMYGYNSDLYQNMSDALNKANGLAAISLLIQVSNEVPSNLSFHAQINRSNLYSSSCWKDLVSIIKR